MGQVPVGTESPPNWRGFYGWIRLDSIEPKCVIDLLSYGNGTVSYTAPGGGKREYGLRELWPDEAKQRDFGDFYESLLQAIEKDGIKVPVLLYRINDKLYCRYGASRLWIAKRLGLEAVPAIVCDFGDSSWASPKNYIPISTPDKVMECLSRPKYVGVFEVSHERIDLQNVVPTRRD